ncbi:MAG: EAL domain-containing protein [Spirochaetales bacterium]|nr:EAL domain-containing protein [Spirochaetales bacterium]
MMTELANDQIDGPARLLVVDDEIWICGFLKEVLTYNGYDVVTVTSEDEALRSLEEGEFDLVLTDLMMGELSGYDIIEKTRQLSYAPEVVVMTGNSASEHATRVLKFGAFDYLTKPIESERLHLTIQRALEHRRLKTEVARLSGDDPSVRARVFEGSIGFYDSVTGLANRSLLFDRLDQAILRQTGTRKHIAVIVVSVDQYRQVSLVDGVARGDALLVTVANRLQNVLFDRDTLARPGSDEFAIVAEMDSADTVMMILSKVQQIPELIRSSDGTELRLSLSCGIAMFPGDGRTAQELYSHAFAALDTQQRRGGDGYQFYESRQDRTVRQRINLERRLEIAVRSQQLTLSVQPYYRFANGAPHGGEALLRWKDEQEGHVSPAAFVPLLERSRLIIPVTEWIVGELARLQTDMIQAGFQDYHLSFNVSPVNLQRYDDAARLVALMTEQLPDIHQIVVELTEGIFLSDTDTTIRALALFRDAGIRTAIDDFGTGYSSLSYLTRFYFEFLKVDRSFVSKMDESPKDETVVSAIISMAAQLGMATVAEGVETVTQADKLKHLGCDLAQGYLFSKPMPADQIVDHFKQCNEIEELSPVLEGA